MKARLLTLMLLAVLTLLGCKEKEAEAEMPMEEAAGPDDTAFNEKIAVIRAFFKAHCEEDFDTMNAMVADDFRWSPPDYNGNQWLGKEEFMTAIKGYHDNFDNIKYTEGIVMPDSTVNGFWSGSIFPIETANTSAAIIRTYGTWTATHTESSKEIGVKFFSLNAVNDEGKIIQSSDYWDLNGLAAQIAAEE